jgi:hypothetical protein
MKQHNNAYLYQMHPSGSWGHEPAQPSTFSEGIKLLKPNFSLVASLVHSYFMRHN